jgi:hypothetical protein
MRHKRKPDQGARREERPLRTATPLNHSGGHFRGGKDMPAHLIKTEQETITIIPSLQRMFAVHMLQEAGIPFKTIYHTDLPEGIPLKCVFQGEEYPYEKILGLKACVDSQSLFTSLEEREDGEY